MFHQTLTEFSNDIAANERHLIRVSSLGLELLGKPAYAKVNCLALDWTKSFTISFSFAPLPGPHATVLCDDPDSWNFLLALDNAVSDGTVPLLCRWRRKDPTELHATCKAERMVKVGFRSL